MKKEEKSKKKRISSYLTGFLGILSDKKVDPKLLKLSDKILSAAKKKKKVLLLGNGASAAIASHLASDLTKEAGIKALTVNNTSLITALSNDWGYETWMKSALQFYADKGDIIILISSSGQSKNIVKAAKYAKKRGIFLATLTGFSKNNPAGEIADINLWVNSSCYNTIECTHMIWLTAIVENLREK